MFSSQNDRAFISIPPSDDAPGSIHNTSHDLKLAGKWSTYSLNWRVLSVFKEGKLQNTEEILWTMEGT